MTNERDEGRNVGAMETQAPPRRELLRLSLGTFGSLLALEKLMGCGQPKDAAGPDAPASPDAWAEAPSPALPRVDAGMMPDVQTGSTGPASDAGAPSPAGDAAPAPGAHANADAGTGLALGCVRSATFLPIVDDGPRSSAVRTSQSNTLDWITIGVSNALLQTELPDTLLDLLRQLALLPLAYPIDLLQHSLQTATRARRAGASDDLVLAALLHHVGTALSVEGCAEISAAIARGYVSEDAYHVMRHHAEYAWAHFGTVAGLPTDQRARYASQPWHGAAVRLADDWERLAYDPAYPSLPLSEFEPLLRDRFSSVTSALYTTHGDCI